MPSSRVALVVICTALAACSPAEAGSRDARHVQALVGDGDAEPPELALEDVEVVLALPPPAPDGLLRPDPDGRLSWVVAADVDASRVTVAELQASAAGRRAGRLSWRRADQRGSEPWPYLDFAVRRQGQVWRDRFDRVLVPLEDHAGWRGRIAELRVTFEDDPAPVRLGSTTLLWTDLAARRALRGQAILRRTLDHVSARVRVARAPDAWEADVELRPGARLRLGCGLPVPEHWRDRAARFRVHLMRAGEERVVLEEQVAADPRRQAWRWADVPLGDASGPAQLVFEVEPADGRGELDALWAAPLLYAADDRPRPPNLILISVDTLRADFLSCYGFPRPTSPHVDRLAQGGVLFERASSQCTTTLTSHASLFTSLYPAQFEILGIGRPLDPLAPTLASMLRAAGWAAVAFADGGYASDVFGLGAGFEVYDERHEHLAELERKIDRALEWIEEPAPRPFFLFLHTFAVHSPYSPPDTSWPAFERGYDGPLALPVTSEVLLDFRAGELELDEHDRSFVRAAYEAGLVETDRHLGRLFDELAARGRLEDSVIVLLADHGEALFEHGTVLHESDLHQTTTHVPLIVHVPPDLARERGITTPQRLPDLVELVDVLPTVLDLLGVEPGGDVPAFQGKSLVPLMRGQGEGRDHTLSFQAPESGHGLGLRTDQISFFELRFWPGLDVGPTVVRGPRLFDLIDDPGEHLDLSPERPRDVHHYHNILQAVLEDLRATRVTISRPTVTEDATTTLDQLRHLGYVR